MRGEIEPRTPDVGALALLGVDRIVTLQRLQDHPVLEVDDLERLRGERAQMRASVVLRRVPELVDHPKQSRQRSRGIGGEVKGAVVTDPQVRIGLRVLDQSGEPVQLVELLAVRRVALSAIAIGSSASRIR